MENKLDAGSEICQNFFNLWKKIYFFLLNSVNLERTLTIFNSGRMVLWQISDFGGQICFSVCMGKHTLY